MKRPIAGLAVLVIALGVVHGAQAAEGPVWVDVNLVEDWAKRQEKRWQDEGAQQARVDIAAGKLRIKSFGLLIMDDWRRKRDRLLFKYGIEEENLGCDMDRGGKYVQAYNAEMNKEIERRYGPGFWDRIDAELQSLEVKPNKPLEPTR